MRFRIQILTLVVVLLQAFSCQNHIKITTEAQTQDSIGIVLTAENNQRFNNFNNCKNLDRRIYTYLPAPGKELHQFTLKFDCLYDSLKSLKGLIFGPSPEGEHGLAFYKTILKDLIIDDSSNVSFTVIPVPLYEQQITLSNYQEIVKASGIDRGEQFFKGKLLGDTVIVLTCSSEFNDCYTNEPMNFVLKK